MVQRAAGPVRGGQEGEGKITLEQRAEPGSAVRSGFPDSKRLRTPPLPGRLEWPWSFPTARRVVPQRMFRLCLFRGTEAFSFLKGAASMTAPNVDALWRRGRCTPKNTPSGLNRNYGFSAVRRTWWSWGPTVTIPPVCLPGTRFPNFPIRCSAGTAA